MNIYKYILDTIPNIIAGRFHSDVLMPADAKVLSAKIQNDTLAVWALIDESKPLETYRFIFVGTGWDLPGIDEYDFIDTVLVDNGEFVYHVFVKR